MCNANSRFSDFVDVNKRSTIYFEHNNQTNSLGLSGGLLQLVELRTDDLVASLLRAHQLVSVEVGEVRALRISNSQR